MTDQHDVNGAGPREDVAYVCEQLEHIRTLLQTHSPAGTAPLERLVATLQAGEDPAMPLDAVHEALLAAGDAVGIHGRVRGLNPIGADPATPREWVLLCPTGQCSRYSWPDGPQAPSCPVSGQSLRTEPL
ncbi:hypothetical protein [Streptomyces sp. NPDC005336]|uniref:hypothetical protein n=1 Tax=unclassified Streptomyces TaxID=2593676 RepID=UPI0033BD187A